MITSRLESDSKTLIPQSVRKALNVEEGDDLAYVIEDGVVVLMRAEDAEATEDPFATFTEWHSEADHKAYDKL